MKNIILLASILIIGILSCSAVKNSFFGSSQQNTCDTITTASDSLHHSYLIKCDSVIYHYLYYYNGDYDVFHKRLNKKTFLIQYFDSTGFLYFKDTLDIEGNDIYGVFFEKGVNNDTIFNDSGD